MALFRAIVAAAALTATAFPAAADTFKKYGEVEGWNVFVDNEKKSCLFLDLENGGCQVYEDRPWACRMYPLGMAIPPARGLSKWR